MPYQESPHYIDETPGNKYYCTCGESANKPYCDGSHETQNTGKSPVEFNVEKACRMAICDCGKTKTSPRCDGSHSNEAG
jgi:CDGSH-type Zn-finger protein